MLSRNYRPYVFYINTRTIIIIFERFLKLYSTSWFYFKKIAPWHNHLLRIIYIFRYNVIHTPFSNWHQRNVTKSVNMRLYVAMTLRIFLASISQSYTDNIRGFQTYTNWAWIKSISIDGYIEKLSKEWMICGVEMSTYFFFDFKHMLSVYGSELFKRNYFELKILSLTYQIRLSV